MNRIKLFSLVFLAFGGCVGDESISKFADQSAQYKLVSLNDAPFVSRATISFPKAGEVIGQAPCNRYFATQTVPYPWFSLEGINATRMACPYMAQEAVFFAALEDMTLAEVLGDTLILSNTLGGQMVFVAR